jgi:translation initiation factor 2 subunit 3
MAIKMSGIKNIIVLLNKLDLVKKSVAEERYLQLLELLKKYDIEPKIIIPVCMNYMIGVDIVLENIMKYMGPNIKKNDENPLFMISRSFDINHVNTPFMKIEGGVLGGSLITGNLKVGDNIEILPGKISKNPDGTFSHKPHYTTIKSLKSETTNLPSIIPGGLIGIGTNIDPFYCKNDNMIGMMVGLIGTLPPVYYEVIIKYTKISFEEDYIWNPRIGSNMSLIMGTNCIEANIYNFNDNYIKLKLNKPACVVNNSMIILCNKFMSADNAEGFSIVAYGYIEDYEFISTSTQEEIKENKASVEDEKENEEENEEDINFDDI